VRERHENLLNFDLTYPLCASSVLNKIHLLRVVLTWDVILARLWALICFFMAMSKSFYIEESEWPSLYNTYSVIFLKRCACIAHLVLREIFLAVSHA